ncbi:PhoH family protein [Flavobacteriales bacterium]|jgi:phosphate starvation-inducible PhoH-like protein|nr:PhoH family protein [Flavobacteriales bacterium]MDC3394771.1 PhoH family protein [Flavobacteriales bacterium]MDG1349306.1 PhoH family protein [Flavobacteriales bacterium]
MSEKLITLSNIELVKLFGTNNHKLDKIRVLFPQIKIVSRGEKLKILGSTDQIKYFEQKLTAFIKHINQYNSLTLSQIERLVEGDENEILKTKDDVILHGQNGKVIKARTANQRKMVAEIEKNDMLFAIGPAGTGKTYTAVAIAVKALKDRGIKRIILTRPAVEAGENLGFLPGDLKEKLDPYMQPIYDALFDMIHIEKLNEYIENGTIQIAPLAFMRGRTLDKAFVILDEGQNTTEQQMKMFLTRMGKSAKFIITGDESQIDLPRNQKSGLIHAKNTLKNIKDISFITLDGKDVIRHKLVKDIINAYKNENND